MRYYIYRHIRLDLNVPFYIGIGTKPVISKIRGFNTEYSRAFEKTKRSSFWKSITNKTKYRVEILLESDDKKLIQDLEKYFINLYGRSSCDKNGTLVNFSEGGESCSGPKLFNISITQLTLDGELVKVWNQLKDIENEKGYLKTNIVKCCKKKQLTAYGFKWVYTNNRSYDNVYPSAARRKKANNRNGIILTHKITNEQIILRTTKEVSNFLGCHPTTVLHYLKKGYNKEYTICYRSWTKTN
jgi:hypothetical protein